MMVEMERQQVRREGRFGAKMMEQLKIGEATA